MTELREFIKGSECVEISARQFSLLAGPGVYLYMGEDDKALYVGSSGCIGARASRLDHAQAKIRSSCKSFLFIPCKSLEHARRLERKLILDLQPKRNKRYILRPRFPLEST